MSEAHAPLPDAQTWQTLVAHALLGTAQQRLSPAAIGMPLLQQLAQQHAEQGSDNAEHWLLLASGVMATYQRAGFVAATLDDGKITPPAPSETSTAITIAFATQFAALLENYQRNQFFLLELLQVMAARDLVMPPHLLPELLDLARRQNVWAGAILPVIGERGRWLAAQHPDWRKLLKDKPAPPSETPPRLGEAELLKILHANPHPMLLSAPLALKDYAWSKGVADAFVNKLLTEAQTGRAFYADQNIVALACVIPRPWLNHVIERLQPRPQTGKQGGNWLSNVLGRIQQRPQPQPPAQPNPALQALIQLLEQRKQLLAELDATS